MTQSEAPKVINYVLGFVFDLYNKKVLLIKKKKPEWQKDLFNGIGGKIEEDEDGDMYDAMSRECYEETSVTTHKLDWRHFCTMSGINCPDGNWHVYCLCTFIKSPDDKYAFRTNEDEVVIWMDLTDINVMLPKLLGNVPWLIGMALDHRVNGKFDAPIIAYSGGFSLPLALYTKSVL